MPLAPMLVPLAAVDCQLWADVPGTQVATYTPAVGVTQLTSPTSVEAPLPTPPGITTNGFMV